MSKEAQLTTSVKTICVTRDATTREDE